MRLKNKNITTLGTPKSKTQGKFVVAHPFPLKKRRKQMTIHLPSSEKASRGRRRGPGENVHVCPAAGFPGRSSAEREPATPPHQTPGTESERQPQPLPPRPHTRGQLNGEDLSLPPLQGPPPTARGPGELRPGAGAGCRRGVRAQVLGWLCASSHSLPHSIPGFCPRQAPPRRTKYPYPYPYLYPYLWASASLPPSGLHTSPSPEGASAWKPGGPGPTAATQPPRRQKGNLHTPTGRANIRARTGVQKRISESMGPEWMLQRDHKCTLGGLCVF